MIAEKDNCICYETVEASDAVWKLQFRGGRPTCHFLLAFTLLVKERVS